MKVTPDGKKIVFAFDGLESITFDSEIASVACRERAEMHGWEQRIRDNAAITRKQKDGTVITVTEAMRRDAVAEMVSHYESGTENWSVRGPGSVAKQNPVIAAIAAKRNCTYAEAEQFLAEQFLTEIQ